MDRLPVADKPMDRAALLRAAANAASAAALGQNDSGEQEPLDGARFEVRVRFGCPGPTQPSDSGTGFAALFNENDRTLRVRAAPDLSLDDSSIAALAGKDVEAVEGFWLRRPWLLSDGCPAAESTPAQTKPPSATASADLGAKASQRPSRDARWSHQIGLAEFFTETDSRTTRRDDRAYEATKVLGNTEAPSSQGYNLVLSGRLRRLPTGRVISCVANNPDVPPECVISAQFDRVWIEAPRDKAILAEWSR